jgi:prepilin-type N-terminal cleavage/methylation domain-containing protein
MKRAIFILDSNVKENAFLGKFSKGFTLIEILIALGLLAIVSLLFFSLFKTGILASSTGQIEANTRENARVILDRIQADLNQARPLPVCAVEQQNPPAVILPWPGQVSNNLQAPESGSIGCSNIGNCISNPLNLSIQIPPATIQQTTAGPSGFLVFSEIIPQNNQASGLYVPPSPSYLENLQNYVWVMYQVNAPVGQPPQLVRYTFPVGSSFVLNGLNGGCATGWSRANSYFVPSNSREVQSSKPAPIVATLDTPKDALWIMVSHQPAPLFVQQQTNDILNPALFNMTVVVEEFSLQNYRRSAPAMATLSSQVNVQGAIPSNSYR